MKRIMKIEGEKIIKKEGNIPLQNQAGKLQHNCKLYRGPHPPSQVSGAGGSGWIS